MDELLKLDEQLFLFLNGFHTPWLDPIMALLTKTLSWIPLYMILLQLVIKNFKKNSWIILIGLTITLVLTDQVTSGLMKPFFERLRPSHEPAFENIVHLVNDNRGGLYGFASSHAANTFGVAIFIWLAIRKSYLWSWLLFLWASLMSYSRVYLGLHYPGDIIVGCLIGILIGWILFKTCTFVIDNKHKQSLAQ
jgi:undecaprenyl-diphosphatase